MRDKIYAGILIILLAISAYNPAQAQTDTQWYYVGDKKTGLLKLIDGNISCYRYGSSLSCVQENR